MPPTGRGQLPIGGLERGLSTNQKPKAPAVDQSEAGTLAVGQSEAGLPTTDQSEAGTWWATGSVLSRDNERSVSVHNIKLRRPDSKHSP